MHRVLPTRRVPGRRDLPEEHVPDGIAAQPYNGNDPNMGHDHTFFVQLSRDVFAD